MLEIDAVSLAFGGVKALSGVRFSVQPGSITSVIGPNGAGKTSLFNTISGFYRPTSGAIRFEGRDITRVPAPQRAGLGLARSFQNIALFRGMTVLDNIKLGRHAHLRTNVFDALLYFGRARREEIELRADVEARIIDFLEIDHIRHAPVSALPYGLQKRVAAQRLEEIALMIYTSGSTGKPKGAMISYANIRAVVPGIVDRLRLDEGTTHLSYLPLCHVAEQMLTTFVPLYLGSQVNFGESIRTVQEDLREVGPTMFLGVPRIWEKLAAAIHIRMQETGRLRRALFERALAACEPFAEKAPHQRTLAERITYGLAYWTILRALQNFIGLRRAKVALTGAAPIPPAIVRFFRTLGVPLVEVYGLTESTGMIAGQRHDRVRIGTVGEPTLGVEHRVADNGELLIRGGMVFCGYYKSPEATEGAIRDGWLHTGDVVREEDGQLKIVDRLKDIMITAGGKNLTPSEIENTMKASPFVKECIVIAEGRKFVSALIQIDYETVGKWAESNRIAFTHFRSLVEHPRVRELIQAEIDRGNAQLAQVSHIRRFHLLTKELDHDDGEVTATMKVRRSSIYKTYAEEIEALYR